MHETVRRHTESRKPYVSTPRGGWELVTTFRAVYHFLVAPVCHLPSLISFLQRAHKAIQTRLTSRLKWVEAFPTDRSVKFCVGYLRLT